VAPLIALTFENKHYDGGQTPHTDVGLQAYARYGAEVVRRFSEQIDAVEIWNEYNGSFAKGPVTANRAENYGRMLRAAYPELKRTKPSLQIAGGATAGVPLPYLEKLFATGALEFMDAVSVHPYRYDETPEGIETVIARLDELIRRYNGGKPKPIWVTEIGWLTKKAGAPGELTITEEDQANFLVRSSALLLSAGVERIVWYLMRDYAEFSSMGLVGGEKIRGDVTRGSPPTTPTPR
jgi:hypothetical protein